VPKYPIATIAVYGPDNTFASKLVVSIVTRPKAAPATMQKWLSTGTDVREDPRIRSEALAFMAEHRVREQVTTDRIIGCPHEEGIDYPMGRTCPACPFWAAIDRFTHEPLPRPVATMLAPKILEALSTVSSVPPVEALESADVYRDALVEPLIASIERVAANPLDCSPEDMSLCSHGLYLLAKWRETRGYPAVIRWLSMADDDNDEVSGDILTEDGDRIVAAVCDGDLEPLTALATNANAGEFGRGAAIGALALLAAWAEVPRDRVMEAFRWLLQEGLEREPGQPWDSLALACADIEALELFPEVHRGYDDDLVDPEFIDPSELEEVEGGVRGERLRATREARPPIGDVAESIAWWDCFQQPVRRAAKIGRNEPCPCGSGKKFKKCCGATVR
jgi:hypothetical protein